MAAASLTVAAAGTAVATEGATPTRTNNVSAGFKDTTSWNRQSTSAVSRSTQRAGVVQAKATAAAKAKARAGAASKARAASQNKARQAALGALTTGDTQMRDYTQPKAVETVEAPKTSQVDAPRIAESAESATTSRSTRGSQNRTEATTSRRSSTNSYAPSKSYAPTKARASRSSERATSSRSTSSRQATSSSVRDTSSATASSSGWVRPLSGGTFTSGYGSRWGRLHAGVDFAVPVGASLRSMNNGTVVATGWYGGQGNRVVVRFANGVEAHYAHMSSISVSPGQSVSAGQTIGFSGNTGNSTGPHLHLEIHIGGVAINPAGWLSARGLM